MNHRFETVMQLVEFESIAFNQLCDVMIQRLRKHPYLCFNINLTLTIDGTVGYSVASHSIVCFKVSVCSHLCMVCNLCILIKYQMYHVLFLPRKFKRNLLWQPSCCHVWRQVIVPLDFFIKHVLPFSHGVKSHTHLGYRVLKYNRTKLKSRGTITHLHVWPSTWPPPHSVNTGVKNRPDSPFYFSNSLVTAKKL